MSDNSTNLAVFFSVLALSGLGIYFLNSKHNHFGDEGNDTESETDSETTESETTDDSEDEEEEEEEEEDEEDAISDRILTPYEEDQVKKRTNLDEDYTNDSDIDNVEPKQKKYYTKPKKAKKSRTNKKKLSRRS